MSALNDLRRALRGARIGATLAVGAASVVKLRRLALGALVAVAVLLLLLALLIPLPLFIGG